MTGMHQECVCGIEGGAHGSVCHVPPRIHSMGNALGDLDRCSPSGVQTNEFEVERDKPSREHPLRFHTRIPLSLRGASRLQIRF